MFKIALLAERVGAVLSADVLNNDTEGVAFP
jgi:hypothetical protein